MAHVLTLGKEKDEEHSTEATDREREFWRLLDERYAAILKRSRRGGERTAPSIWKRKRGCVSGTELENRKVILAVVGILLPAFGAREAA